MSLARPLTPTRLLAVGLLAVVVGLAGCGRKSPPGPPPDADPADVRVPSDKPTPPPQGERPTRPFILDGLL